MNVLLNWELAGRMFVSDRHRYIWISNPKCGSSTMKLVLSKLEFPEREREDKPRIHGKFGVLASLNARRYLFRGFQLDSKLASYTKFTVIRNPYSRIVSAYKDKILRKIKYEQHWYKKEKRQILEFMGMDPKQVNAHISFDDFIHALSQIPEQKHNAHWRPQHRVLHTDRIHYDLFIRIENLHAGIQQLGDELGANLDAGNSSSNRSRNTNGVEASEQSLDLIRKIYHRDFEQLGYDINVIPEDELLIV